MSSSSTPPNMASLGINKLSWEILDTILSLVPPTDESPLLYSAAGERDFVAESAAREIPPLSQHPVYATVCKAWQSHFENRTFNCLKVRNYELEDFKRIVVGKRRAALRRFEFVVVLPAYSAHACARYERERDQKLNDGVYTDAIHGLFMILKSWETEIDLKPSHGGAQQKSLPELQPLEVDLIDIYSPTDAIDKSTQKLRPGRKRWLGGVPHDLWEARYAHSYIQLLRGEDLPSITRRTTFTSRQNRRRNVMASSVATIASKFTNLESVQWYCNDSETKYPLLRQRMRYDFSQSLLAIKQPSLRRLALEYCTGVPRNHSFIAASALHSSWPPVDCLSMAIYDLRNLSNLTHIVLSGPVTISSVLYWNNLYDKVAPHWPSLQQFNVTFNPCTPDGDWYFIRHPGEIEIDDIWDNEGERERAERDSESATGSDTDDSEGSANWDHYHPQRESILSGGIPGHQFRTWPNDERILPLLRAMAMAAACMPAIRHMSLHTWLDHRYRNRFEVAFLAPGVQRSGDKDEEDRGRYRLYWRTGDWRPDEEVLSLWKRAVPDGDERNSLVIKFFSR